MDRTLLLVKPDGVQRGLVGEIVSRVEGKGLKLIALKLMQVSRELAEKHYAIHREKPFYSDLIDYITSAPVVAMVVEGPEAVAQVRTLVGATFPEEAAPGSIRGDLASEVRFNLVHASDSKETAAREISAFFTDKEIISYQRSVDRWICTGGG